jgi:peroxiredoxin
MPRSDDLYSLPPDIPVPVDDGACAHLTGARWLSVPLPSTAGRFVDVSVLSGRTVIYAYPRTGLPDRDPLPGWDLIPGARGCTPQSCSFRDHHRELAELGARVFGLSTNPSEYQREAAERLHLPFELLSDASFELTRALRLPTFEIAGYVLLKRFTLIARDGVIEHVMYPVFPPDKSADDTIAWLRAHPLA